MKINIIADKNKRSLFIKRVIKAINLSNINKSNLNIVIGGDGFMLKTLKKNRSSFKLYYGINSGNYGFLMNSFSKKNFVKRINNSSIVKISPLEMRVKTKNSLKRTLAINEVSILRQSRQAALISIKNKNKYIIKRLVSDGVLVSTPAGSTAYNLSVYGPILNLNSKKLSIAPISAFRPRRWKGKIISNNSIINIKNLNPIKRPISAVADNAEVRNAINVRVNINKKIKYNLLYDKKKEFR